MCGGGTMLGVVYRGAGSGRRVGAVFSLVRRVWLAAVGATETASTLTVFRAAMFW